MKKALDGIFKMLRNLHREQKRQTKILQAIENSLEQEVKDLRKENDLLTQIEDVNSSNLKKAIDSNRKLLGYMKEKNS